MEFILHRFRNLTILVMVIAAQLLLLAYQVKSAQDVRLIRVWAVTAVTPLARGIEFVRSGTVEAARSYFLLAGARQENERLKAELAKLKLEKHFLENELATAQRAQALAAFQARTPSKTLAARIIGTGPGVNSKVVFVDRGLGSGIMKGMAVVTPDGIVGKVIAAYPTASQVMLITDPSFAAGVISQKNRVHGTVKGTGHSVLTVEYVQNEQKVEVGEIFFTSGDDRIFPKGLPVGAATVVREGKNLTKEIFLTPSGLQRGLEEVLILVEGVHQDIPDFAPAPQQPIYMLPPPPAGTGAEPASPGPAGLNTDADRLRERYRRIGEAQGHVFGEGAPGSRPPNFNLPDPARAQPAPATPPKPGGGAGGDPGTAAAPGQVKPAAPPAPARPGGADPNAAGGGAGGQARPPVETAARPAAPSGAVRPVPNPPGGARTNPADGLGAGQSKPAAGTPARPAAPRPGGADPNPDRPEAPPSRQ